MVVAAARVAAGEVVVGALVQILHGAGGGAGAGSGGAPASAAGGGGSSAVGGGGSAAAAAAAAAAGEWGIGRPPQYVGRGAYGGEENVRKSSCPFLLAGSEERSRTMVQEL